MNVEALKNESVAYALAAGLVDLGSSRDLDREIERAARRQRIARRAAK
ncbi:hypothetical protein ACQKOE_07170 [Novosphingobium sp. NPDC080210]